MQTRATGQQGCATAAETVLIQFFVDPCNDSWMSRQSQVVVTRKINQRAPIYHNLHALRAAALVQLPRAMSCTSKYETVRDTRD